MDEFLSSIWTAEENQAQTQNPNPAMTTNTNNNNNPLQVLKGEASLSDKSIVEHTILTRQGSLTFPTPLCRKTVDEVWSEIHKSRQEQQHGGAAGVGGNNNDVQKFQFYPVATHFWGDDFGRFPS